MRIIHECRGYSCLVFAPAMLVRMCFLGDKRLAAVVHLVCATKIGEHEGYIFLRKRTYVKLGSQAFDVILLVVASNRRIIFDGENEPVQVLAVRAATKAQGHVSTYIQHTPKDQIYAPC
jgi:hypothetical protein